MLNKTKRTKITYSGSSPVFAWSPLKRPIIRHFLFFLCYYFVLYLCWSFSIHTIETYNQEAIGKVSFVFPHFPFVLCLPFRAVLNTVFILHKKIWELQTSHWWSLGTVFIATCRNFPPLIYRIVSLILSVPWWQVFSCPATIFWVPVFSSP